MANNYTITFKSLRTYSGGSPQTYVLTIGGGIGSAIALKPGSQPFTTDEDADEDQFKPIRTQTGYFRIVDDGKDAGGNAFDWKDLIPANDTARPVTLTANGTVLWTGFMQAQNFGGVLYGNPQEREFPVQCVLSVLGTYKASTSESGMKNFAWLLKWLLVDNLPSDQRPTSFIIQGGADARQWLLKRFDWMNFMQEVEDGDIEPRYSHYDILEDMCKFWGWTIRTHRRTVYMTMTDDTAERGTTLTLDQTALGQLAAGTSAGTVSTGGMSVLTIPNAFASTSNDTYQNQGPSKATVKADVNKNETVIKFAPSSVRQQMEAAHTPSYTWVQAQGQDLVGYFETGTIGSFETPVLSGSSVGTYGGFCRRQVYTSKDSDDPAMCDDFLINFVYDGSTAPVAIRSNKAMSFAGGSLKIGGQVYFDEKVCDWTKTRLRMRLGIGMTRASARWWYMKSLLMNNDTTLSHYWSTSGTVKEFSADCNNGQIKGTKWIKFRYNALSEDKNWMEVIYDTIPVPDTADMYGFLFIEFLGLTERIPEYPDYDRGSIRQVFQIANFEVKFSRDTIDIQDNMNVVRGRSIKENRVSSREYSAENSSRTTDVWNADCIFASDNNMEYGYGLLMNADGTFMPSAPYAAGTSAQRPEQHLANRVATYWGQSRRRIKADLQSQATISNVAILNAINPGVLLSLDGSTCHPIAISHEWRDDVTTVTMLEMPT